MRGEGKRIPSIIERHSNAEVAGGAPEQQMTTYYRGNSTQKTVTVKNAPEQKTSGTREQKIKFHFEDWLKQAELRLERKQELDCIQDR